MNEYFDNISVSVLKENHLLCAIFAKKFELLLKFYCRLADVVCKMKSIVSRISFKTKNLHRKSSNPQLKIVKIMNIQLNSKYDLDVL